MPKFNCELCEDKKRVVEKKTVIATTLRSLLEMAQGPIALVLDEKKDEISVMHPYDF